MAACRGLRLSATESSGTVIGLTKPSKHCPILTRLPMRSGGHRYVKLNLGKDQLKSADYFNPRHKVPLLIVDGAPTTENVAIQIWIARNSPGAKLPTSDLWQKLQVISILAWCASGIHPDLSRLNSTSKVCDLPSAGPSVRRLTQELLFENYNIAEDMLACREYFFDHFTAADAHFFWCFHRGSQFEPDLSGSFQIAYITPST